jgi:Zn finger protein HypA/HybF involved in hydrogenase expression
VIRTIAVDALDACWACGSIEVESADDGRVLCSTCRSDLANEPAVDPMHLVRGSYWEAHVLVSCWRCLTGAVDAKDDVGLCPSCRRQLTDV